MAKIFLMCGIPGSGKSTWIKAHLKETDAYVSRDEIRFSLLTDKDDYFAHEGEVYDIFIRKINDALKAEKDVYIDATHLTIKSRREVLKLIDAPYEEINIFYMNTPLETALERNEERKGRAYVPPNVIKSMYHRFKMPEYKEGFKNIWIVTENGTVRKEE